MSHIDFSKYQEDYQEQGSIGSGTFGSVLQLKNRKTGKLFALKKVQCQSLDDLSRSIDEIVTVNKAECRFIVQIYYHYMREIQHQYYDYSCRMIIQQSIKELGIIMELGKCSLSQELQTRKKTQDHFTKSEMYKFLYTMIEALAALEKFQVSHRDIKPQNIIIFENGDFKLTDFGLSEIQQGNNSQKQFEYLSGSPAYMAPLLMKYFQNQIIKCPKYNTFLTDVFSLGLTTLEAASLQEITNLNVYGIGQQLITNKLKFISKFYDQWFVEILLSMLVFEEQYRPSFQQLHQKMSTIFNNNFGGLVTKNALQDISTNNCFQKEINQQQQQQQQQQIKQTNLYQLQQQQKFRKMEGEVRRSMSIKVENQQFFQARRPRTLIINNDYDNKDCPVDLNKMPDLLTKRANSHPNFYCNSENLQNVKGTLQENPFMAQVNQDTLRNQWQNDIKKAGKNIDQQNINRHNISNDAMINELSQKSTRIYQEKSPRPHPSTTTTNAAAAKLPMNQKGITCEKCLENHMQVFCVKCFTLLNCLAQRQLPCHCHNCLCTWDQCECLCMKCRQKIFDFKCSFKHCNCQLFGHTLSVKMNIFKNNLLTKKMKVKDLAQSQNNEINSMVICEGGLLAAGMSNGSIELYNTDNLKLVYIINGCHSGVVLKMSAVGNYLISGSSENQICVNKITANQVTLQKQFKLNSSVLSAMEFHELSCQLFVGQKDGTLQVWTNLLTDKPENLYQNLYKLHQQPLQFICFMGNSKCAVASRNFIFILSIGSFQIESQINCDQTIGKLLFYKKLDTLIVGTQEGNLMLKRNNLFDQSPLEDYMDTVGSYVAQGFILDDLFGIIGGRGNLFMMKLDDKQPQSPENIKQLDLFKLFKSSVPNQTKIADINNVLVHDSKMFVTTWCGLIFSLEIA